MEFVRDEEVLSLLKVNGVAPLGGGDEHFYFRMTLGDAVVRIHVTTPESQSIPVDGARVVEATVERLPEIIDGIIHHLRLTQLLLIPVAKWRAVFDAVAFSMAENEDWQEVDATATVELNTRDPLLCEPGDFHVVEALVRAIFSDAELPEQGLTLTTTAAPVLIEVIPDGAVRLAFGNQALADEATETILAAD